MADDVASLGFAIDSTPLVQGALALKSVSASAKDASASSKDFSSAQAGVTSASRQSAAEVQRLSAENARLQTIVNGLGPSMNSLVTATNNNATANNSLAKSNEAVSNSAKSANDNIKRSSDGLKVVGDATKSTAKSIFDTGVETLKIAGYLKLATTVAYAASPAFKSIADTGLNKWAAVSGAAVGGLNTTLGMTGNVVGRLGPGFVSTGAAISNFVPNVAKASSELKPFMAIAGGLEVASLATHFPLAAAGALGLSSAVRQVAGHEVVEGFKGIGEATTKLAPAAAVAGRTILTAFAPVLTFAATIAAPITIAVGLFEILHLSWELASERMQKAADLVKKSLETGLGVEMVQRVTLSAAKIGSSIDAVTESMKKFNDVTKSKPQDFSILEPGDTRKNADTDFKQRLDELVKLGNFAKNQFVDAFNAAQTTGDRYNAVVQLITKAMNSGERLAALNLASTFLSDKDMANLRAFPTYLEQAQKAAAKVSAEKLISTESIALAQNLSKRLEEAEKILGEKWIPFEERLVALGLGLKDIWITILETMAHTLEVAAKLPDTTEKFTSNLVRFIPLIGPILNMMIKISDLGSADKLPAAKRSLAEGLLQPELIRQTTEELTKLYGVADKSKLDKPIDTLKNFNDALKSIAEGAGVAGESLINSFKLKELQKAFDDGLSNLEKTYNKFSELGDEVSDKALFDAKKAQLLAVFEAARQSLSSTAGWDKEIERVTRHIALMQADAAAVGKTEAYHEQLRNELQLLEAAERSKTGVTAAQIDKYAQLRTTMTVLQALESAGINLDEQKADAMDKLSKRAGGARDSIVKLNFEFEHQKTLQSDLIATQALQAKSPQQKGDIAEAQKRLELQAQLRSGAATQAQVDAQAASARKLAIDTEIQQIKEGQRVRLLAATQTAASAQVDIKAIGQSVGEQYKLTTIEQTRQQLEQEAAARKLPMDNAELARLTAKINITGNLKQKQAELAAQDNANFDLQTALLSDTDRSIASVQRSLHGNAWKDFMNDGLSATIRVTAGVKLLNDSLGTFASSFAKDLANGVNSATALRSALQTLGTQLLDIGSKQLVSQALGGLTGLLGGDKGAASSAQTAAQATQTATIFTTAATEMGATWIAAATQAAAILSGGGITAGSETAAGGVAAGTAVATGGETAGVALLAASGPMLAISLAIAAVVAGLAAIAGSSNSKKQEEEEHNKAVQAWNDMASAFNDFTKMLQGAVAGELSTSIKKLNDQALDYYKTYYEAHKWEGNATVVFKESLDQQVAAAVARLVNEFKSNLPAALAGLRSGIGLDAGVNNAIANTKQITDKLKSFLDDVVTAGANIDDAKDAVKDYLMTLITGVEPVSDVQQKLFDLQGAAIQVSKTLEDLGFSADQVANAVAAATTKMHDAFTGDLQKQLNAATGKDFINSFMDLFKQTAQQRADSDLLGGGDQQLIDQLFKAQAQNIIDQAGLVGDSFDDLVKQFPDLIGVVHQATANIEQLGKTIDDYLNGLQFGQLSTLSESEQFGAAQGRFQQQFSIAKGSGADAIAAQQGITQVADQFLQIARTFLGPSEAYGAIYDAVTSQLRSLPNLLGGLASGGMVGNGMWNVDSVRARYAGGGDIALAGGEGVINAAAARSIGGAPAIDFINSSGSLPGGSGATVQELRGLRNEFSAMRSEYRQMMAAMAQLLAAGNVATTTVASQVSGLRTDARQKEAKDKVRSRSDS